jgi:beta-lactam-binding protein with PASTA domain
MSRLCSKCGFENADDVDFCSSCGEYLRWELTGSSRALPEEPAEPPTAAESSRASPETRPYPPVPGQEAGGQVALLVALRLPDDASAGEVATTVEAGSTTIVIAFLRNQSGIVDNYDLRVEGLPEDWWSIAPATVYLVPYGAASGEYEQEVTLTFHPPRASEAQARVWPIRVVATSRVSGAPAGEASARLEIRPYHELEAEMRPETASARRRARYAIALRNRANASVDVELAAVDPEGSLRFKFEKPRLSIEPGRRNGSTFEVSTASGMLFGRSVPRRFEVASTVIGSDVGALPTSGTFVQKPWLPGSALVLGALVVIGTIAAYLLWPRPVTVPSLKGKEVFAAQTLLDEAGLELGNRTDEATNRAQPGTILAQSPEAGEEVDGGDDVSIQVAVATETAVVPDIVGLTLAAADGVLSEAEFSLGDANPEPADPERSKIVSQIPVAGVAARKGRGVDVYFGAEEGDRDVDRSGIASQPVTSVDDAVAAAEARAGRPADGNVEVPDLSKSTSAQASEELTEARLTPVAGLLYSADAPAGQLVTQSPDAGTSVAPWTKVAYFYAAPYPELAFEADGGLFTMNGANGTRTGTLIDSAQVDTHPAWNPTGTTLAFRRGTLDQDGQIWLVTRDGSSPARQITSAGFDDRRPAFSPDGKAIAFVRGRLDQQPPDSRDYDLCLVKASGGEPSCIPDETTTVFRPAWAPDGRSLLVISQQRAARANRELVAYTSSKSSSPREAAWRRLGPISDALRPVRDGDRLVAAALSPDGKRVALSVNWGTGAAHLVLATRTGNVLSRPIEFPNIRSCELSWRSDGGELAVVQRGDDCRDRGMIVRFDPRHAATVPLTSAGDDTGNPAWFPARR